MIKLDNISYEIFDKEINCKKTILKDLNLSFEQNKITVITGHNGSGKSTLIKIIMGIIRPTSGRIFWNDRDITDFSIDQRANLGMTIAFQQPVKFKGITVKDLLDLAIEKNTKLSDACQYLSAVGLCAKTYINREIDGTLSGGELKRIELAISLAKGGDVLLFDEPEAGIDLWSFDELVGMFKKLKNKTVIIVSHQNKILDIADNILLLDSHGYKYGSKKLMLGEIPSTKCSKLREGRDE